MVNDATISRFRLVLICASITANSLVAGGIFIFPILSPGLAAILKLRQPQLTTISIAGMIGQYLFAPLVGKVLDLYGPSRCSLISAGLFSCAFFFSSALVATTPVDITQSSSQTFYLLSLLFLLAGLGTVFSCFSCIFAASRCFPRHPGAAAGASTALFGLSPLCLSLFASNFFADPVSAQLKVAPYLRFLAVLVGSCHLFGSFTLPSYERLLLPTPVEVVETSPLIAEIEPNGGASPGRYPNPFSDRFFWILTLYCLCSIGASEMVMANMAAVVFSLPSNPSAMTLGNTPDVVATNQVKIISISNTISRLVIGPLADFVSPVASHLPTGAVYSRKHRISRVAFLSGPTFLLALVFLWMDVGVRYREEVWVLSVGTGINYGSAFTILPGVVSSGWGPLDLGRNFGILTYAPFVGTPLFSYLFAFGSSMQSGDATGLCKGPACWRMTFGVTCATSLFAVFCSMVLWKHWKSKIQV